jgi:hypothetical protein
MVVNSKFTFLNRTVSLLDGSFMYISIPLFSFLFFFFFFSFFYWTVQQVLIFFFFGPKWSNFFSFSFYFVSNGIINFCPNFFMFLFFHFFHLLIV